MSMMEEWLAIAAAVVFVMVWMSIGGFVMWQVAIRGWLPVQENPTPGDHLLVEAGMVNWPMVVCGLVGILISIAAIRWGKKVCGIAVEVNKEDMAGTELLALAREQGKWSQETFGLDSVRGPIGPLKHLEKEAREAAAKPEDREEYADCLILLLDASRRAGISPLELIKEARKKMVVNKERSWPKAVGDEAVEHLR